MLLNGSAGHFTGRAQPQEHAIRDVDQGVLTEQTVEEIGLSVIEHRILGFKLRLRQVTALAEGQM